MGTRRLTMRSWSRTEKQEKVECFLIGAGQALPTRPGDDYGWVEAWEVYCCNQPEIGVGESRKIKLRSEAILVRKLESSSGIIYWDGKNYQWYQQGD